MTTDGTAKDDVKVPDGDIGKEISSGFEEGKDLLVTIVSAMSEEQVSLAHSPYCPDALTSLGRLFRTRKPRKALSPYPRSSRRYFPSLSGATAFLRPFI